MADHIRTRKSPGTWSIRAQGAVLGESSAAIELSEGSRDPVIYFPRSDIAMAFLEPSDKTTHCPHKGDTTYYGIAGKSGLIENAAWSYESPIDGMEAIARYLTFDLDKVTVEEI